MSADDPTDPPPEAGVSLDETTGGASDGTPDATTDEPTDQAKRQKRPKAPLWQETLLMLGFAVVLAVVIKAVLVQAFYIPSESMEPGLVENDRIAVQKVSYWFNGEPQRGDVVVFADPGGWLKPGEDDGPQSAISKGLATIGLFPSGGHLVKRVVGVEGDTIVCCDAEGRISVNGVPLDEEDYAKLDKAPCYGPMTGNCDWTSGPVPPGKVFVMGDNRSHSGDSTEHLCTAVETDCVPGREFVDDDLVVGKVAAVVWPFDRARRLGRPDSFADVPDRR